MCTWSERILTLRLAGSLAPSLSPHFLRFHPTLYIPLYFLHSFAPHLFSVFSYLLFLFRPLKLSPGHFIRIPFSSLILPLYPCPLSSSVALSPCSPFLSQSFLPPPLHLKPLSAVESDRCLHLSLKIRASKHRYTTQIVCDGFIHRCQHYILHLRHQLVITVPWLHQWPLSPNIYSHLFIINWIR